MWFDQPPKLWVPEKPAIVRPADFLTAPPFMRRRVVNSVYTHQGQDSSNITNYSFAGCNLGTEAGNRYIIVVVHWENSITISSLTIGGVSASKLVGNAGTSTRSDIWMALVPTGTTGTIAVNFSAASNTCTIDVFALYNLRFTTPYAQAATAAADQSYNNTDISTIPAGSCVIAGRALTITTSFTWFGLIERSDRSHEANYTATAASNNFPDLLTGVTISVNALNAAARGTYVAVCMI